MSRQPQTTVSDDTLRRNIGVSAALHLGVLLFLYFGLPVFVKPLPTPTVPIPIDIVDISDITNTRVRDQEEQPPKPPEPPKEEAKVAPPPPTPTPPPPQAQPEPPKPPPPPPEAKPEQVEAITPAQKPPEKKPLPPKPEKPKVDPLASVLKNVEKMKPVEAPPVKTQIPVKTQTQSQAQPKSLAPALSDHLSMTEEDALRRQVEQCWNFDPGMRNAKTMVVEVNITVNQDKTVQTADIVDKSRANSDPYFRAAAEAAIRALYNPRCNPLQLPDGKYDQWKVIDFTFDPRDML